MNEREMEGSQELQPDGSGAATCPNCGTVAPDRFCPSCGQRQGPELIPTPRMWLAQVIDELLFVEARLPRTLARLYWPPGALTAEWWSGKRASYVHPLRVYLLVAIPFFFGVSIQPANNPVERNVLEFIVEGTYILSDVALPDRSPLMAPLPPELANDSTARAQWQAEFERRRAEDRATAAEAEATIQGGIGRIAEALPIVVGAVMVPWLALLLWSLEKPRRGYVASLVFSMHLHTILYTLMALGWLVDAAVLVGFLGTSVYLGVALARLGPGSKRNALAQAIVVPVIYGVTFVFIYGGLAQALATFAPGWFFTA